VVAGALDHAAVGHPIELDIAEELPEVVADPGLLERVVANLVEERGALHAARPGDPGCRQHTRPGRRAPAVIDRGPGIPSADREAVFAGLSSAATTRPRVTAPASGLGLAIARGFTEAMHGHPVWTTPRAVASSPLSPCRFRAAAVTRILIVDDEPQLLRALVLNLHNRWLRRVTGRPARTRSAGSRELPLTLVVLDLGLPGPDGLAVIGELRAREATLPIIILSARSSSRDKVAALDLGAKRLRHQNRST